MTAGGAALTGIQAKKLVERIIGCKTTPQMAEAMMAAVSALGPAAAIAALQRLGPNAIASDLLRLCDAVEAAPPPPADPPVAGKGATAPRQGALFDGAPKAPRRADAGVTAGQRAFRAAAACYPRKEFQPALDRLAGILGEEVLAHRIHRWIVDEKCSPANYPDMLRAVEFDEWPSQRAAREDVKAKKPAADRGRNAVASIAKGGSAAVRAKARGKGGQWRKTTRPATAK